MSEDCALGIGRYEYVRLDTLIPVSQRSGSNLGLLRSPWSECKAQWRLVAPSVALTFIHYSFTLITDSVTGHLGKFQFASLAIAYTVMRLAYGFMLGMGSALETLCGQAFGARQFDMLGIYMQRSVVILFATSLILSVPCIFAEPLLRKFGQSTDLAKQASILIKWMLPQLFACSLNFPIQKFLYSQSLIMPMFWVSLGLVLPHLVLSYLSAFSLDLGLLGVTMVQNLSCWLLCFLLFIYLAKSESCRSSWTGFSFCALYQLPSFMRLSLFSAIMTVLQVWYYQVLILLAGTLSDPEIEIDALSICLNMICLEVMVPYGFNASTSIRVSNELGAGNSEAASFSVSIAMAASSIVSILLALIFLLLRNKLGYLFINSSAVAERVSELVPFLAATVLLNGVQSVLSGVAIGSGWQSYVAYVNIISCYLVGLPLGLLICFKFQMGITPRLIISKQGIWSGMIAGQALQVLIVLYATWNANWSEQANQTIGFLRTWRESSSNCVA
ncbi:protein DETOXIFICATION 40 isoform X2 [Amborella trichopoda]|uniref:protein DETOXIFICATION 40 isoform X2 n=1 Tax=Amborella trichopoda TaxID=13333 RepID=UPI0005D3F6BA|nr:protein DETOXIFICATION 40 isoform X2 [Amborella trichopoda]|eukprot:XP_011626297.1 protein DETOXIFICATION 40 isoform X2 [Amborella trichopoda]